MENTTQLSGLTDYELQLEKIVDEIKAEQSILKAIGILRRTIDQFLQPDVIGSLFTKIYEIDFGGNLKTQIKITEKYGG